MSLFFFLFFFWFFRGRTFEECLVGTVNQGADADTTGAICGMLAGACYGMDGIPRRWYRKVNPKVMAEIELLTDKLLEAIPLGEYLQVERQIEGRLR